MVIDEKYLQILEADIEAINQAETLSDDELLHLHRIVDAHCQACIERWYNGLNAANTDGTDIVYSQLIFSQTMRKDLLENLILMREKIRIFQMNGMNRIRYPKGDSANLVVNNEINVDLTFNQARSKIEDMTSLTSQQTEELLDKISQIEKTINGSESKKTKWEKMQPILEWLAKESLDIGKIILPLLLNI